MRLLKGIEHRERGRESFSAASGSISRRRGGPAPYSDPRPHKFIRPSHPQCNEFTCPIAVNSSHSCPITLFPIMKCVGAKALAFSGGMNFGLRGNHSVILMSVRPNAPYQDRLEDGGTTLIYEGHDQPKTTSCPNPKLVDQPGALPSGTPTQNGRFIRLLKSSRKGNAHPSGCAFMKRFAQVFGRTTASFISSMRGRSVTSIGSFTSLSSLR
jgi:hypothetical protein